MAKSRGNLERPLKRAEFAIRFATRDAEKGWQDLVATARNAAVDAWDFLTKTPMEQGEACYHLAGDLSVARIDGRDHDRWQYKPTSGGRVWYVVVLSDKGTKDPGLVVLERVVTGHPNETIKNHR